MALTGGGDGLNDDDVTLFDTFQDELLDAGQEEYTLYGEQLAMTERHLDTLIEDTNSALKLLASLSESFRGVEEQTTTFQAQCEDLLLEESRLEKLAIDVGTDLHYYAYIDSVSRRLNAPGASRLVEDESFGEILQNLDSCIAFMELNVSHIVFCDVSRCNTNLVIADISRLRVLLGTLPIIADQGFAYIGGWPAKPSGQGFCRHLKTNRGNTV